MRRRIRPTAEARWARPGAAPRASRPHDRGAGRARERWIGNSKALLPAPTELHRWRPPPLPASVPAAAVGHPAALHASTHGPAIPAPPWLESTAPPAGCPPAVAV